MKEKEIDIKKIIKENRNVDVGQLSRNLDALKELREQGVNTGPNYNLESPFAMPVSRKEK